MKVIIHKHIESIEEILPTYNQLKDQFREITVFQNADWLRNWLIHKSKSKKVIPYIVEIKLKQKIIGIIPLYLSDKEFSNMKFRILRPIGVDHANYLIPILSKDYKPEFLIEIAMQKIYKDKMNWDCIHWGDLPKDSDFDSYFAKIYPKQRYVFRKETSISPRLLINTNFEHVKKKIDQKLLKEIIKKDKKLKKRGKITYRRVKKENEIEPIMNVFYDLHCKRWNNTNTPSRYELEEERRFSLEKAKSLFRSNLLFLTYLEFNGEITSVEFAMADNEVIYLYYTAYNMNYSKYSVGNLGLYYLIEEACKLDYKIVDFLRGNEAYKQKWGTINKVNLEYLLFNSSIKSLLFKKIHKTYYSKDFIQNPFLNRIFVKLWIRVSALIIGTIENFNQKITNK